MNAMKSAAENRIESGGEGKEKDIVLASCLVSLGIAIYLLYAQGKREAGFFVGLWAPTLLGLEAFLRATRAKEASGTADAVPN
jgi:hypothetical protein